jgi:PAS domain S-box-containing protein
MKTPCRLPDWCVRSRMGHGLLGLDGAWICANEAMGRTLRRPSADIPGRKLEEMLAEESRPVFRAAREEVLSGATPSRCLDLEFLAPEGQRVFTDVFFTRFDADPEGPLVVQILDITRHKETETGLAAAKRRLHLTAEIAGMGFWEYNFQTGAQNWDDGVFRIYGIRREDFTGKWQSYVHPDDLEAAENIVWELARTKDSGEQRFRTVRPDGSIRHIQSIFTLQRNADGSPGVLTGINFDITDSILAERAAKSKAAFLAGVSHEIRTPLATLVNLSQSLLMEGEKHALPGEFEELLESVRAGGQYLNLILTNLLDVSATESGHAPVRPETFYLRDWVEDVSAIIDPIARSRSVKIVWCLPQDDNLRFTTDPVRLTQILLNLAHNAVKFSIKQDAVVRISIVQDEDSLSLSVSDEGPGIPPARIETLFREYGQINETLSRSERGVGLGLAIVRQNTDLLGGTLETRPVEPTGICFEVVLPDLKKANPAKDSCAR